MTARDKLRAYALEEVTWTQPNAPADRFTSYLHHQVHQVGQRGEYAGKAFTALQDVIQECTDALDYGETIHPRLLLEIIEGNLS